MILTASAAILDKGKVLLVRRNDDALLFPGNWAFPGGRAEENETPEQTVIREVREETNLVFTPLEIFMTGRFENRTMNRFLGHWSGKIVLQEEELSDFGWFTYDECMRLSLAFDYHHAINRLLELGLLK